MLVAGALASICAAQDAARSASGPSSKNPVIKVEVNQVLVPVVVTDKRGHSVTGLSRADFEVFEDGEPQPLTAFSTESDLSPATLKPAGPTVTPAAPVPAGAAIPPGTPRRTYVVCLDTLNSSFGNLAGVVSSLRKFFKQEQGSDSQYALVALGRQAMVIRDLTRDPDLIFTALQDKNLIRAIGQSESGNLAQQESELSRKLAEYCERCPCAGVAPANGLSGSDHVCEGKRNGLEIWAGSAAEERGALLRGFLSDLKSLVAQTARQPGKRDVILISDGFSLQAGRDLFAMMAIYFQDPAEEMRNTGDSMRPDLEAIVHLATSADVTFYTLDSRGLYTSSAGGFDASHEYEMTRVTVLLPQVQQQKDLEDRENQDGMAELAASTGGVFYHNSNDIFKGLRQAFAEGREYYLLAYNSTHKAADGKFREIKVDVKGRNLLVRAKRGYWAPGPEVR